MNPGDDMTINIHGKDAQEVAVGEAKNSGKDAKLNIGLQNLILYPNARQNTIFLV